jgi:predicted cation transporter
MIIGLLIILLLVLFLPFFVKYIEENLEVFLFIMGFLAAIVGGVFDTHLLIKGLEDPIKITIAVLVAGLLFKWLQSPLEKAILGISHAIPFRLFIALIVIILGLISSVITAIIAALILVLIVSVIKLDRQSEVRLVVLACFSIGLGAALTPIGEPLSTIAISKLGEDFFYLLQLIGPEVISAVLIFGIISAFLVHPKQDSRGLAGNQSSETYQEIIIRTIKIYLFVMGLTLLGAGFEPLINQYLLDLHPAILYWINMISATLDNATLAAAEISPAMDEPTIKAILLGLMISGGMLIPGNIPNIIAAGKLGIESKEWAKFGVPVGLIAMFVYFIVLFAF